VADSGHDRVLEFNSAHKLLRQFGSEGTAEGQFNGIRGIATNSAGDVYVVDYANDRVQEFSPEGAFIRKFGSVGSGAGQFIEPTAIAVDSSGNVWVLNTYGAEVQEFLGHRHISVRVRLGRAGRRHRYRHLWREPVCDRRLQRQGAGVLELRHLPWHVRRTGCRQRQILAAGWNCH
jgi:DNA-binding beta-propeller fold protein YncE